MSLLFYAINHNERFVVAHVMPELLQACNCILVSQHARCL